MQAILSNAVEMISQSIESFYNENISGNNQGAGAEFQKGCRCSG